MKLSGLPKDVTEVLSPFNREPGCSTDDAPEALVYPRTRLQTLKAGSSCDTTKYWNCADVYKPVNLYFSQQISNVETRTGPGKDRLGSIILPSNKENSFLKIPYIL